MKGLQFNSFSTNLLATGAADGELCIWDLSSPAQPSLYPALRGGSSAAGSGAGEVTYLAWNCKVQHILASTSVGGSTIVWDLKRQKPVISFTDPNRPVSAPYLHPARALTLPAPCLLRCRLPGQLSPAPPCLRASPSARPCCLRACA